MESPEKFDLVINHGTFFDGTAGTRRAIRHIGIRQGRVACVRNEPFDALEATKLIDATGKWVMPGFFDNHTHYDAEILGAPGLNESVRHGVTTIVMGSCSLSTIFSDATDCADMFSRVEALPRQFVLPILTEFKTWTRPAEYVAALERLPLGPHVASFVGHSDLRCSVLGLERAVDANVRPSRDEMKRMLGLLEEGISAGLLGLSTMTNPWDKLDGDRFRSRKLPSAWATWREYRQFHEVLRRTGRVLQSAPNITTKFNALLFAFESAGFFLGKPLKTALITAADTKANPGLSRLVTFLTDVANRLAGANLRWQTVPTPFDVYADGMDLVVFEEFGAGEEALHLKEELDRNVLLSDQNYRRRFRKDYDKRFGSRVWQRDFYDAEVVASPDSTLVGQSFGQIADVRGIHPVDAFLDLVVAQGSALRWHTVIANHEPRELKRLLAHPAVQPGFSDSGAHVRNMAFYNFPLHLLRFAKETEESGEQFMSVERAVHRLTAEQAEWYGVDAGRLHVGDRADIAIIDPAGLDHELDAYHEAPVEFLGGLRRMVRRNDRAVRATIISGKVVFENGRFADGFGREFRTGEFLPAGRWRPSTADGPRVA